MKRETKLERPCTRGKLRALSLGYIVTVRKCFPHQ